jgi:uncharacterized protein (DUF1499 family)
MWVFLLHFAVVMSCGNAFSIPQLMVGVTILLQSEMVPISSECTEDINPSRTVVTCRQLGLQGGSLRGCKANENCFSTSSKTATKQAQPWYYGSLRTEDAFIVLKDAIKLEGLTVLQAREKDEYILAAEKDASKQPAGASLFYEFLLKPEDGVVVYRGVVDKTVFVYPLQQPVSDFGALRARLEKVYERTGFTRDDNSFEKVEFKSPFFFQ